MAPCFLKSYKKGRTKNAEKNLPTPPNSYDFNQSFLDINDVKHIRQEIVVQ